MYDANANDARSDAELLDATPRDPQSFGEFYLRHGNRLFLYFRQRTGNTQDAYDLVSETFAQALSSIGDFDPERGVPAGWLFGIAKNKLRRAARQGAVETRGRERLQMAIRTLDSDAIERLEESLDLRSALDRLQPAIHELPPMLREAVQLRCLDDESYEQIADLLEIRPATARKRVSRGIQQLEHHFTENPYAAHG
ncbi:MAG: sigma-70 family RNA polymerase sigma factor [Acidimicrobiales bacterium]